MELPDRIEDMNRDQRMHLDMLIDQVDAEFPLDRMDEERLAKDPHLAILPSGRKLSTNDVRDFECIDEETMNQLIEGGGLPYGFVGGNALVTYRHGGQATITNPHDIAAFNAALNDIGVYVAAPTMKGDDADGDGIVREGTPHESATGAPV